MNQVMSTWLKAILVVLLFPFILMKVAWKIFQVAFILLANIIMVKLDELAQTIKNGIKTYFAEKNFSSEAKALVEAIQREHATKKGQRIWDFSRFQKLRQRQKTGVLLS